VEVRQPLQIGGSGGMISASCSASLPVIMDTFFGDSSSIFNDPSIRGGA